MKKLIMISLFLSIVIGSNACIAETVNPIVQAAITAGGEDCAYVTKIKGIGADEGGNAYIAALCSNGSQHVLKIFSSSTLDYITPCWVFEAGSGIRCF